LVQVLFAEETLITFSFRIEKLLFSITSTCLCLLWYIPLANKTLPIQYLLAPAVILILFIPDSLSLVRIVIIKGILCKSFLVWHFTWVTFGWKTRIDFRSSIHLLTFRFSWFLELSCRFWVSAILDKFLYFGEIKDCIMWPIHLLAKFQTWTIAYQFCLRAIIISPIGIYLRMLSDLLF